MIVNGRCSAMNNYALRKQLHKWYYFVSSKPLPKNPFVQVICFYIKSPKTHHPYWPRVALVSWTSGLRFDIKVLGIEKILLYPAQRSWKGGILVSPCPSVGLSVCPSVCRRHGFRSISEVCFGILISNFICMLMVAIGRSLLIFSNVTFKLAAWHPY